MDCKHLSTLIRLIALDDCERSFRDFYGLFFPRMYEIARYYTKSTILAEEVVGDVFIRIWKMRKKLPEISDPESYLFIAVKRRSLDVLKLERKNLLYIDRLKHELVAEAATPDQSIFTAEFLQFFAKQVESLPEKTRLVFKLIKMEGKKYREVAELLDISVKTVEMHITNALKRIRMEIIRFELSEQTSVTESKGS